MTRLLLLALRNVSRNRRRSVITLGAVLVGVTAIIMLRGITYGFSRLMVEDAIESRVGALQIHAKGYGKSLDSLPLHLSLPHSPELMEKIRAVPGVRGVAPRIVFGGLISNGIHQAMFIGRGLDPEGEKDACPRAGNDVVPGGRTLRAGDEATVIIGYELASGFKLRTVDEKRQALKQTIDGAQEWRDTVTLSSTSPGGRANALDAQVVGFNKSGLAFDNKRVLTVPLTLAQTLVGLEGRVTEYAVAVHDREQVEQVANALRQALGGEYEVQTWMDLQPFLWDAVQNQAFVLGLVGFILFAIVLTGIINTMLMSVFERVREIGTMLALGVRRRQVLQLFLMESMFIGLAGGLAGGLIGRVIVWAIAQKGIRFAASNAQDNILRPEVTVGFIAVVIVAALFGSMVSALYPAWKASRQNPVDALRSL